MGKNLDSERDAPETVWRETRQPRGRCAGVDFLRKSLISWFLQDGEGRLQDGDAGLQGCAGALQAGEAELRRGAAKLQKGAGALQGSETGMPKCEPVLRCGAREL